MTGPRRGEWIAALAAALALHGAALWLWQRPPRPVIAAGSAHHPIQTWRVQVRTRSAPVAAPAPAPVPRPEPTRRTARAKPEPLPIVEPTPAEPPAPTEPPPPPVEAPPPAADSPALWLDANQADQAPVPLGNTWLLTEMPWPAAFPLIEVHVWVSAQGRIERFEVQGEAAADPAVQQLFAPFADTPMRPATIGVAAVPSVLRIQIWPGEDGLAPDFIAPLPAASR